MQGNHPAPSASEDHAIITTPATTSKSLADMPAEVLMYIAVLLPYSDFARFLQTNSAIHSLLDSHYIWHRRFIRRFGQDLLEQRLGSISCSTKGASMKLKSTASSRNSSRPPSPGLLDDRSPMNSSNAMQANNNNNNNQAGSSSAFNSNFINHNGGNSSTASGSSSPAMIYYDHLYHNHQDPISGASSPLLSSSSVSSFNAASPQLNAQTPSQAASTSLPIAAASETAGDDDIVNDDDDSRNDDDVRSGDSSSGEDAAAKRLAKGKGRKIDLRKTTKLTKQQLIELYKKYAQMTLPAEEMDICHMGNRYWKMVESRSSTFGKLAQLYSVWWMDVSGLFISVPAGRYKVQWRVKVTSDAPIINSEFKAILFDTLEDKSVVGERPNALYFKPRNVQEFMECTDSNVTKADRKPFRKLFKKGFTIMELPGDLIIEEEFQNVFVQIRNCEGWKSGLYVDYVRLVDMDSPKQNKHVLSAPSAEVSEDEEVNDEGEEYYPTSSSSSSLPWLQSALGINPDVKINPLTYRSRAFRQYNPADSSVLMNVGARSSPSSSASTAFESGTAPTSSQARPSSRETQLGHNGYLEENPNAWYGLYAVLILYCIYIFLAQ
ncbi:hypothetical protein EDD11_004802 [Mortierella claussenii]|nr:hypothetical protein EDD11_004802 [Mortierella claussenii]